MKLLSEMTSKETAIYFLLQCVKNPYSVERGSYFMQKEKWVYFNSFDKSNAPRGCHWCVLSLDNAHFYLLRLSKKHNIAYSVELFISIAKTWFIKCAYAPKQAKTVESVLQIFDDNARVIPCPNKDGFRFIGTKLKPNDNSGVEFDNDDFREIEIIDETSIIMPL